VINQDSAASATEIEVFDMKITAAVATAAHARFDLRELEIDSPQANEVLVSVKGVGLCHTDLIARDQFIPIPLPVVLGHEGSGIVAAVGANVHDLKPGDHVVMSFASCGHCRTCEDDLPSYCQSFPALNYSGRRPDGTSPIKDGDEEISAYFFGQSSFASMAITPRRNVVKVDAELPVELLGPLGCGIQTGVGGIMKSMACKAGSTLVILGGGAVGLSAVMGAKVQGCSTIIVVEPLERRRALAVELGATHTIDPQAAPDLAAAIREIVPEGVNYAFETSGRVSVVEAAMASLASHGVLGLVGVPPKPEDALSVNLATAITFGHQIIGIIEGDADPQSFIPEMLKLHLAGKLPFEKLIKTFPLDQINEAITAQHKGECVKVVLIPG
jgi:aryl-alcohol dehydrogenase